MKTPIFDFVTEYVASDAARLHMPGHKGKVFLGCEGRDITEIAGADALYEASGIIAESEANATALFGTGRTLYSTEGSTQCLKAMLELAKRHWQSRQNHDSDRPVIVAARNVHKAFLYAAILLDFDVVWLWRTEENPSLCSCEILPETVESVLAEQGSKVAAVYLTSPNYLGGMADVSAIAEICHSHKTLLCVDNAHGAYLHFLEPSLHPMDLGADLCCDSAHKTLPVLTGGAYLHISKNAPDDLAEYGKPAMELFGSTSPSYLILQSLDLCNAYLAGEFREELGKNSTEVEKTRQILCENGWKTEQTDPLRITIKAPEGFSGIQMAELLRKNQVECEHADEDYLVCMVTPHNKEGDLLRLQEILGQNKYSYDSMKKKIPVADRLIRKMTLREAYSFEGEWVSAQDALHRICRMPMSSCPPAVPVVVPGELIDEDAIRCFRHYGIEKIEVVKEKQEDSSYGKSDI